MIFGPTPLDAAEGAVLAHSMTLPDGRLKKGSRLGAAEIARLRAAGRTEVIAARLDAQDVPEDVAAARLGAALAPEPEALGLSLSAPFTGRLNVYALTAGVLRVDAARVAAVNAQHEAVTLATLPDMARVQPRQMLGTVKIIPYAAPSAAVEAAAQALAGGPALRLHPVRLRSAAVVLTVLDGMKPKVIDKGGEALRARLAALGVAPAGELRVAHAADAVAGAIRTAPGDAVLILSASATSDRRDVGPAGLEAAGGRVTRFGMPVDPGNLMFLGEDASGRPVIGMPGCARSPALNGVDWVLERIACGIDVTSEDVAAMGVGGLLKEIPSRPQPRGGGVAAPARPVVSALLLAAGSARRMGGRDKLLETVEGEPMLRRAARALLASGVDEVVAVLRADDAARAEALADLAVRSVENPEAGEGMAASIRAGLRAMREDADACLLALADMPEVGAAHADRLLAAFDPGEGRAIVRATDEDGRPGHPVLFGRRFFESLARLSGDEGAREILRANEAFVTDVTTPGRAARLDLDTPEAWAAWRAERSAG
ncbi:MAG: molybdopterin-binding/glycosyltransferase family 2 protein [Pseudomonadota bacterium]